MTDNKALGAADPELSACVLASAGTGKTWMLVTRLTRLLLAGADPGRILALTFTRKAAAEMQQRLLAQLKQLLQADDAALNELLTAMGEQPDATMRHQARHLYETLLRHEQPLRTSTFHGFCQDLLQRFPLESGLPPGFELTETTGLLYEQAWDALFAEATTLPDGELADDLDLLFDLSGGLYNVRTALYNFLNHRSDWWAYTQHHSDPVCFADNKLSDWLEIDPDAPTATRFWTEKFQRELDVFSAYLDQHPTKTNTGHSQLIQQTLKNTDSPDQCLHHITPVFLTKTGDPKARKTTDKLKKQLGETGTERFLELHVELCEQLQQYHDSLARLHTWQASTAWYRCGSRLLEHYQRIKRERRLVDFTDLEWKAYTLLNHPEQAHWIQYKIDQRIDHLLIDEFQDTNPTQWHLLKPLLDEMSAGAERQRSLFLVGDAKQSIYRFRRGDPALLKTATDSMQQQLEAGQYQLDSSWRSSPAIMECVNRLFENTESGKLLTDFSRHDTHRKSLWGQVELWPLFEDVGNQDEQQDCQQTEHAEPLRNPLQTRRMVQQKRPHYMEGRAIAKRIEALVSAPVILGEGKQARAAQYNDIIILLRSRTHLTEYEAALQEYHIPCLSMDRGTLLNSLEIRDMEALLNVLMTPQDNLALAQVLRSPVFSATDEDLIALAAGQRGAWIDKLENLTARLPEKHSLARAHRLLNQWRDLAGCIPIHDLLDRIYHQADILRRYQQAFPDTLLPRLRANLTRFIELALEVDAGRYPSLPHFLARLQQLRSLDDEAPDQATPEADAGQRVRIMTIHAAKGLEAGIIFLADTGRMPQPKNSYNALVRWPAESEQPEHMLLRTGNQDSKTRILAEREKLEEIRESANLLYVALTRAKQLLFISGCKTDKDQSNSWYSAVAPAFGQNESNRTEILSISSGDMPAQHKQTNVKAAPLPAIDPALLQPASAPVHWQEIAPSHVNDEGIPEPSGSGRLRGRAIHLLLQLATEQPDVTGEQICAVAGGKLAGALSRQDLLNFWEQLQALFDRADLRWIFRPEAGIQAYNEAPIVYRQAQQNVYGIIDRLLVTEQTVHIIDYKTHRINDLKIQQQLCDHYRPQLAMYGEGAARLWPDRQVKTWLLFTHTGDLVAL